MPRYRTRLEIIADIVNAVGEGSKKTRIMYIANLSYRLLERYLKKTAEAGLMISKNDSYEVTEKGRAFLERFNSFSSKHAVLEREFEKISFEREVLERMCNLVASNSNTSRRRR